mmetsp:Transcript_61533/g.170627  ORF Transcript_61533/g.170627 Transcript_61533/m.170627 type:complete len:178 (+) Transcript_61533:645-1178(+)
MSGGQPLEDACVDYKGPAAVLCYAKDGRLLTVDFVGVCYKDGTHCMAADAWWVGEQWRLNLTSGQWLYRDARAKHVADVSCSSWTSQKASSERPPPVFIQAFHGRRSFVLHELQPWIVDGLPTHFVWKALTQAYAKEALVNMGEAKQVLGWINAGLAVLGTAQQVYSQQRAESSPGC